MKEPDPVELAEGLIEVIEDLGVDEFTGMPSRLIARWMLLGVTDRLTALTEAEAAGMAILKP